MNHTGLNLKMRKLNIGIIKSIFFLLLLLTGSFYVPLKAQNKEDIKKKIMEVKLNDDFIFGEGVSDNKDIAYGLAMDDLLIFANELKGKDSQEKLTVGDLVTKTEILVYENGSRVEVIVYIPVDNVLNMSHKQPDTKGGVVLTRPGILDTEEIEEPKVEMAKVEEPKLEEPIVEESIVEEPVIEEPIVEEPVIEETKVEEPVIEEPIVVEPVIEEPIVEEPVIEEPKVEEPITEQPVTSIIEEEVVSVVPEKKPAPFNEVSSSEVEDFLLTQDNFTEIKKFLSEMKQKGKIKETGVISSSDGSSPKEASLILMDEFGGILAILSPVDNNGRINYKTHKPDTENNYNSKFILWYKK